MKTENADFIEACIRKCNQPTELGPDGFYRDTVKINRQGCTASMWAILLAKYPEVVDRCDLDKLNGYSRCYLLSIRPELSCRFSMEQLADADHAMWGGSKDDFGFGWKMLIGAHPEFKKYQPNVPHEIALILSGTHFSVSRSDRQGCWLVPYYAWATFRCMNLDYASLSAESNLRYSQIVNTEVPSARCQYVDPGRNVAGDDVAVLSDMGQSSPCQYSVQEDEGVSDVICEMTIDGEFDPQKFEVIKGRMYLPDYVDEYDLKHCDADGYVSVITKIKYDGEELRFYCSEFAGEPDNGWSARDEWHYVVDKGVPTKIGLGDDGEPKWPK